MGSSLLVSKLCGKRSLERRVQRCLPFKDRAECGVQVIGACGHRWGLAEHNTGSGSDLLCVVAEEAIHELRLAFEVPVNGGNSYARLLGNRRD